MVPMIEIKDLLNQSFTSTGSEHPLDIESFSKLFLSTPSTICYDKSMEER
jgi:hypothetical protein